MTFHPNKLPFKGVLTQLGVPSDKAPSGARGHRVILTEEAAREALPGLIGMAVDYKAGWDGHDSRQKVGIITDAEIKKSEIRIAGYLFSRDFPEVENRAAADYHSKNLGMSYELADAHVADMRKDIWTLTRVFFIGAAILLREKAAYNATSFSLVRAPLGMRIAAEFEGLKLQAVVDEQYQ